VTDVELHAAIAASPFHAHEQCACEFYEHSEHGECDGCGRVDCLTPIEVSQERLCAACEVVDV
jgi:hypothetical protein